MSNIDNIRYDYRHEGEVLVARVLHGRRDQAAAWSEPEAS
jgi:hypothetical protein